MEQVRRSVLFFHGWAFSFLAYCQNRERLRPLRSALTHQPQENRNADTQSGAAGDEIPQLRQGDEKDQCAPDGEDQPDKSGPDGEFVHADPGMTVFAHCSTSALA
jgi:hypothetical protein